MGGRLSVTDEYASIGNKSLKSTAVEGNVSIDMIHIVTEEQIGHTGVISCDTYSKSTFSAILIFRTGSSAGSASVKSTVTIPANENTHVSITLPEILPGTYSIFLRLMDSNGDEVFVDNFVLNLD